MKISGIFLSCALVMIFAATAHGRNMDFSISDFSGKNMDLDKNCTIKSGVLLMTVNTSDPELDGARYLVCRSVYGSKVKLYDSLTRTAVSFNTSFRFAIQNQPGNYMGDGMAFVIAPTRIAGNDGGALGIIDTTLYPAGAPEHHVVAIEFDTFKNTWDINSNHAGLDVNDYESILEVNLTDYNITLNDYVSTKIYQAWINYDGVGEQLDLYMAADGVEKSYASHIFSYKNFSLSKYIDDYSYVGFSASTGFYVESHKIYDWSFSSRIES